MLTKLDVETTNDAKSERSMTALLGHSEQTVGSKAKAMWKSLKEENAERKNGSVQYVSREEATAITGHGEANGENGKGDKRTAASVTFL